MGIDFGHKNVGIAITDDSGVMAFPHSVLKNDPKLLKAVSALVIARKIDEIVIGHSVDYAGKANKIHAAVEEFMLDLTLELGIPIHLEPEQYSTQQALRIQGRNSQTDAAAAAIILDSYITKHR